MGPLTLFTKGLKMRVYPVSFSFLPPGWLVPTSSFGNLSTYHLTTTPLSNFPDSVVTHFAARTLSFSLPLTLSCGPWPPIPKPCPALNAKAWKPGLLSPYCFHSQLLHSTHQAFPPGSQLLSVSPWNPQTSESSPCTRASLPMCPLLQPDLVQKCGGEKGRGLE